MGIFDFLKRNKERFEKGKEEILRLEKPDFGEINIEKLEDYYDSTAKLGGREIVIDLNFETNSISQSELKEVFKFIDKIPQLELQNRKYIQADFEQEVSMTSDYLNFYLDELDENELAGIIDINNRKESRNILLLKKLKLIRVGIYTKTLYFGTFDYSIDIDGEPCNQLLVVNINKDGSLDYVTWES